MRALAQQGDEISEKTEKRQQWEDGRTRSLWIVNIVESAFNSLTLYHLHAQFLKATVAVLLLPSVSNEGDKSNAI